MRRETQSSQAMKATQNSILINEDVGEDSEKFVAFVTRVEQQAKASVFRGSFVIHHSLIQC